MWQGAKVIRFILTIKLIMESVKFNVASSLKKSFCVIMVFMASLVAFGQQPFEGKIVYTLNTTSRGLYKMFSDIQGTSEEVVYITNDKFILFNVATQNINFIDLEANAWYIACPAIQMMQKGTISDLIETAEKNLNKGGQLRKLRQFNTIVEPEGLVDGYHAIKYSIDTSYTPEGASYIVTSFIEDVCLKDFLSPELLKPYSYFYGIPYYEHTSEIKQDCPAPLLKSVRYQTRVMKSMERMTPDASVFTVPSDMKEVSQRDFVKAYNKYMKGLNKTREKNGTSVEYTVPEDIWDF